MRVPMPHYAENRSVKGLDNHPSKMAEKTQTSQSYADFISDANGLRKLLSRMRAAQVLIHAICGEDTVVDGPQPA